MANYKTSWVQRLIEGAWQKTFAFAHAKTVYTDYANKKTLADKLSEIDTEIGNKANKTEIPTELPANGGNSATVNGHTVKSDVPENAVFTDTVYDYSALLGYDIYNLVDLKDATYPANKKWLLKDFIAPFDGHVFFMVQTDATSGAFTQVLREDDVLVSNNQRNIADFNTWGEAYNHPIYKGKNYHFESYNNTATAFNKVMLCIRKKAETPTEYVPYAPSNVTLEEENAQQSTEIMDIKMLGWSVPRECTVQNEMNGNQFIQKVGRVDLGSYDYSRYEEKGFETKIIGIKNVPDRQSLPNIYCNGYRTVISDATWVDGDISMAPDVHEKVYIMDTSYTDVVAFKSAMQGKYLYYELATPITTTIDGNEIDQRHSTNLTNQQNNGYLQKNLVDYKSLFDNLNDNAEGTTHTYSDGILKISRTANIYSGVYIFSGQITPLQGKELVVSFDAKSSVSTMNLRLYIAGDEVSGTTENLTTDYKRYRLNVKAGSTQNVLTIYGNDVAGDVWIKNFMITEKSVEDTTYVDYIKSNRELDTYKAPKANPVFTGSISMGRKAGTTVGKNSTAEGSNTTAIGSFSHAEGYETTVIGYSSHAEGYRTTASEDSSHAEGYGTTALACQHAGGHHNNTTVAINSVFSGTGTGTSFVIGNGTSTSKSNAFRVDDNGTPYSKAGLNTTGADYAEFFEWEDGNENNEDRRGYFVTLDGKHIKIANKGDWILGIVSGFPAIIGNGDEEWKGRYVFDDFGCPVIEEFEYEEEEYETITNADGEEEVITKKVKRTGTKWKEVPEYDPERPYVQRSERQEWSAVGMLGVLSVRDDGSCKVNGFCKLADGGIATDSDTGYRVVKRVTDNIVEVIFK